MFTRQIKNGIRIALVIFLGLMVLQSIALAAGSPADLVRGQDRIDVPSVSEGLCVHNLFQSNMVIQRDKPVGIWGWASPGEKVTVTLDGKKQSVTGGKDRAWKVTFDAMKASTEPVEITVKGKSKTIKLDNILVGDVWVLGGQSNMEHPICRTEDGDLEIASANFENIRILTVPSQNGPEIKKGFPRLYEWHSFFNTHYRKGDWDVCTPEIVYELSGIGYVFARRVHMASQIPIGVIDASRGGTNLETWLPDDLLRKVGTPEVKATLAEWDNKVREYDAKKDLENRINRHNQWVESMKKQGNAIPADRKNPPTDLRPGPAMEYNRPGNCYASMIAPIKGFPVKGAIWHQGYTNASYPEGHVMYYQLFSKMIEKWREDFNNPEMAFGILALCTDGPPQTLDNYLEMMVNEGPFIRQVQYQTYLDYVKAGDKNVGFVSSYDMRRSWYHPQLKVPVGERAARWALATQYGMNIAWKPPMITDMKAGNGKIVLTFDMPVDAKKDSPIEGFAIAGKDRQFQPAMAKHAVLRKDSRGREVYDYNRIELASRYVAEPVHYRYAWGRNPMGNLRPRYKFDSSTLATQRSDDWKIHEVPVKFGDKADRGALQKARINNRALDMQRRINDAKYLLMSQQNANTADKLKVVVLTGGHGFDQPPFYKMFSEFKNADFEHVKIGKECKYFDDISKWKSDVIVFYNFNNKLTKRGQDNLLKLCDEGVGLVVLHHAISGFPEWEMWPKISGGLYFLKDMDLFGKAYKRSTYKHDVKFKVTVKDSASPVTAGLKDFEIYDETYKGYFVDDGNNILLTTNEALSQHEIGWTRTFKKSRVCFIQLGHGKEAYENTSFRQLLEQSIDWAGKRK